MLEKCDGHEPVVYPQVREEIPHGQICPSKVLPKQEKHSSHDDQAQIAEQDEFAVFCFIQRTRWVEVVDTSSKAIHFTFTTAFALALVTVVASDVGSQI